jgi:hypothetical protein
VPKVLLAAVTGLAQTPAQAFKSALITLEFTAQVMCSMTAHLEAMLGMVRQLAKY